METRKKFKQNFIDQYNSAFEHYISGDWDKAREEFEMAEVI
jgi:TolA-binding protein